MKFATFVTLFTCLLSETLLTSSTSGTSMATTSKSSDRAAWDHFRNCRQF